MLALYNRLETAVADLKRKFTEGVEGQTMVEYVMLIVLVALAVFLSSPTITSAVMSVFTKTSSVLAS